MSDIFPLFFSLPADGNPHVWSSNTNTTTKSNPRQKNPKGLALLASTETRLPPTLHLLPPHRTKTSGGSVGKSRICSEVNVTPEDIKKLPTEMGTT